MIRLTWRQFRTQATVALGALAVIGVILAITGPRLVHLYDTTVTPCAALGDCEAATSAFAHHDFSLQIGMNALLLVVPALIGVFWGAPLIARELETGTFRLAWTQSVTRSRWLVVKLAILGLSTVVVAGLLSLMVTWWFSPIDKVNMNRFGPGMFGQRGITPIGYAVFAFALGVTAGMLIRRTLPAMATTLAAFAAARLAMTSWVRPHFMGPVHVNLSLNPTTVHGVELGPSGPSLDASVTVPNAWVYPTQIVNQAGHALTPEVLTSTCPHLGVPPAGGPPALKMALQDCVTTVAATFHGVASYQPADRYWAFQLGETAIFIGVALILAGLCLWWVRHRIG